MSDFLFELGVEEVPVSEIPAISHQLKAKLIGKLEEHMVPYKYVDTACTNRRFMIYVGRIDAKAKDLEEQIKGPAKRIAYDESGTPTIALEKFLEFNNVELTDLKEINTPKGVYLVVERKSLGRSTNAILKDILPEVLSELTFTKGMVWNDSRVPFVRPIKSLLALLDGRVVDFEFAGVKASNKTFGHILLSDGFLEINSFKDYCELLNKHFVIVREDERRKKIVDEITYTEEDFNANIHPDRDMLDGYVYNNEYPVVFHGLFDKKYLELPPEIISTFMIKEKKLLPVYDRHNKLLNVFIGVSSIPDENRFVARGNEKVTRATFDDAKFFWDNDRKENFVALRENLKSVNFHEGLGNFYEKTNRLFTLVNYLVKETGNEELEDSLKKAALYCKNDLVTRMVREFPSLQGVMGGLYLKEAGADAVLWETVYGHYEPKGFTKNKVEHLGAGLLSISDKMDNIAGFMAKGIKISGSKDPYGIRRDANALIKIIIDLKLTMDLVPFIKLAVKPFEHLVEENEDVVEKIKTLFLGRIENILKDLLKVRYDVVNAVLTTDTLKVYRMFLRSHCVAKIVKSPSINQLTGLHKRLKNIIKKSPRHSVVEERLQQKEEIILYEVFKETRLEIETAILGNDYLHGCSCFLEMKPLIDDFFDKVLVMAEDPALKENRIALLQQMDEVLSQIADFSLIVDSK